MASFLDLPRELRDMVYLYALSEDGKISELTWTDKGGEQMLSGPKVLGLLLSCIEVHREMKDTMHNDLTICLETEDMPTQDFLGKLHAREAKKLSVSRFTSHAPLRNTRWESFGMRRGASISSSVNLLNMNFPSLCNLELGVDVLEFIDDSQPFNYSLVDYFDRTLDQAYVISNMPIYQMLQILRSHPNIGNLHIQLVWETFLEDNKETQGQYSAADQPNLHGVRDIEQGYRKKIRDRTVELVKLVLPTVTVTSRVASDE